ncbi:MAG TPA: DUF1648 domain-containing protein [Firmicutes bacterium]|nr:DUF1648 domain-containing protein [Bacillota bacterium]
MEGSNRENGYGLKWETLRQDWPLWVWMAGLLVAGLFLYPILPERVPSHWNIRGEVDAYSSRAFGAFFAPLLNIGLYLLMLVLPLVDPRRENYARFAGAYRLLRWGIVLFGSGLYLVTILSALGYRVNVALGVKALVAILFILIGNFMGQLRHNYFVGIKTPWTLANEEVWRRTHRMAGPLWVVAGFLELALSPVQALWGSFLFFTLTAIMVVVPIVYSYLAFRRLAS